jgi:hypothetical protein
MLGKQLLYELCATTLDKCADERRKSVIGFRAGAVIAMQTELIDVGEARLWVQQNLGSEDISVLLLQSEGPFAASAKPWIVVGSVHESDPRDIVRQLTADLHNETVHVFERKSKRVA